MVQKDTVKSFSSCHTPIYYKECAQTLNKILYLHAKLLLQPSCAFYRSQGILFFFFFLTTLRNNPKLPGGLQHIWTCRYKEAGAEALNQPCQLLRDPSSKVGLQAVPSTPVPPRTRGALLKKTDVIESPMDTSHHKCLFMSCCDYVSSAVTSGYLGSQNFPPRF